MSGGRILGRIEERLRKLEIRVLAVAPVVIRIVDTTKWPEPERSVFRLAEAEGDHNACDSLLARIEGDYPTGPVPATQATFQLVITGPVEREPEPIEPEPKPSWTPKPDTPTPKPATTSGYVQEPPSHCVEIERLQRFGLG